jgi:hypothetical protein
VGSLVFWTCRIFKINPKFDIIVKDVILKKGSYNYGRVENKDLYLYIDRIQETFGKWAKLIEIYIDVPRRIFNREEGYVTIKETVPFNVCLFETFDVSNFLAVFGSSYNLPVLTYALKVIISEKGRSEGQIPESLIIFSPLFKVIFKLKGKESELSKYFSNIREISVKGIKDIYVHAANLRGLSLELSEEYQKYVRDAELSGKINYFGVTVEGRVIMLSSEGKIWTRQGKNNIEPEIVKMILEVLDKCGTLNIME